MRWSLPQLALALALALLCARPSAAAGSVLVEPTRVTCQGPTASVVLNVVNANAHDVDGLVTFNTRLYEHNGVKSLPGPTIVMKAGKRCNITIVNKLSDPSGGSATYTHANTFQFPDMTNLHTHGLHVSPAEDDVSTHVPPGASHSYVYNVPETHLRGQHWYHAHQHGSIGLQLVGGLAGALEMAPADSYTTPADIAALYDDASRSHTCVLMHMFFSGSDAGTGAFLLRDYNAIASAYGSAQTVSPSPTASPNAYVVNGQYQPVVHVQPGDTSLFRFVHAGGIRILELELTGAGAADCTMTLLARDGVFQALPYPTITAVVLLQGTRADVAVHCTAAAVSKNVTVAAVASSSRDAIISTQNRHTQAEVMRLVVGASVPSSPVAVPTTAAPRPAYLTDLTTATNVVKGGIISDNRIELAAVAGTEAINSKEFPGFTAAESVRYVDIIRIGSVYEYDLVPPGPPAVTPAALAWQSAPRPITGRRLLQPGGPPPATSAHPYHQHVNHFQIQSTDGGDVFRQGEWRDVAPAIAPNGVKMRFSPSDYPGELYLHCHIAEHEDEGMMGIIRVCAESDNTGTCSYTVASPANHEAAMLSAAPLLALVLSLLVL